MTIDPFVFCFSVICGLPIGAIIAWVGIDVSAKRQAQKFFDSMLLLRQQATEQMDAYAKAQAKANGVKKNAVPKTPNKLPETPVGGEPADRDIPPARVASVSGR